MFYAEERPEGSPPTAETRALVFTALQLRNAFVAADPEHRRKVRAALIKKRPLLDGDLLGYRALAAARVTASSQLREFAPRLLSDDAKKGHLRWVSKAKIGEILAWLGSQDLS